METQFVTDEKGKKLAVILPIRAYQKILDALEEAEDIRLYDEVKAQKEEAIPFDKYLKKRKKSNLSWIYPNYFQDRPKAIR